MAKVVLAPGVQEDFARILDHLLTVAPEAAQDRIGAIIAAFDVLETSPMLGRPSDHGMRELVIGSGASGHLALYRYVSDLDLVFILAVRGQREAGYRDPSR